MGDENQRACRQQCDWCEVAQRVYGELFVQAGVDGDGAIRADQEGMSVRCAFGDDFGRNIAVCACTVIGDYRLSERFR